jgi:hypothetical protein
MALMTVIALFTNSGALSSKLSDSDRCSKNQEFFCQMLYRYLCSSIGRPNAIKLVPRYLYLISQLEEMAQIMVTKKLTL